MLPEEKRHKDCPTKKIEIEAITHTISAGKGGQVMHVHGKGYVLVIVALWSIGIFLYKYDMFGEKTSDIAISMKDAEVLHQMLA